MNPELSGNSEINTTRWGGRWDWTLYQTRPLFEGVALVNVKAPIAKLALTNFKSTLPAMSLAVSLMMFLALAQKE